MAKNLSFKDRLIHISNLILEKIYQNKIIAIAAMELSMLIPTKKFLAIFLVMLFPVIVASYPSIDNLNKIPITEFVRYFEKDIGNIILSYWVGLPGQIIAIMIASEFIAGELDKETLKLLFTKPMRKIDIILGKLIAFIILMLTVMIPVLLIRTSAFILIFNKGYDELVAILSSSFWWGLGIIMLGLIFISSLGILISSLMKKPLYAALAAIIFLVGIQLFIGLIPFISDPTRYTFTYQMGVILEEVYYLSDSNLYRGDPLLSLTFFVTATIIDLIIAEIALIRKEVP
ncbi:MAG: ABC transporter permease subunit [Candidatus Odinarchaeota archaeon]|nr:ABC transporter permease subunit [Candidatus Odinarchaeota archaeon]